MLFSTTIFISLFLPAVLLTWFLGGRFNFILLIWSLIFYFYGEGWHIGILFTSIFIAYGHGLFLTYEDEWPIVSKRKNLALKIAVTLQLLLLIYFKYAEFFAHDVLKLDRIDYAWPVLPLGISFFVFQGISYSIDVHRNKKLPTRNLVKVATYLALFPQLIAGPIVRYETVARALEKRSIGLKNLTYGGYLFVLGLAQKVLIADKLAQPADALFNAPVEQLTSFAAWSAALLYTGQIYFDFAGYSNMAIGLGFVFGLKFPRNFNFPYIALSVTNFWQRWHMSLTRWFRDYVYIPLGGNRGSNFMTYRNLVLVFLLSGLWHGAAWTFVLWGVYHGALLVIERLGFSGVLKKIWAPFAWIYTFLAVVIGWVLFRAESLDQFTAMLAKMFIFQGGDQALFFMNVDWLTGVAALSAIALSTGLFAEPLNARIRKIRLGSMRLQPILMGLVGVILFVLCYIEVAASTYSPFIYFRF